MQVDDSIDGGIYQYGDVPDIQRIAGVILCAILLIITFWWWIDLFGIFKMTAVALAISSFIITYSLINWSE